MALISLLVLAVIMIFVLIASVPLLTEAYQQARDDVVTGGWRATLHLAFRTILWLIAGFLALCFILLLGMFGAGV